MARDQTVILSRDRVRGAGSLGLADRLPGRQSLAVQIALVTTAVAACAVLLAGLVSVGQIHQAAEGEARDNLAADADLVATAFGALEPGRPARNLRLARMLRLFEQQGLNVEPIPATTEREVPVLSSAEADAVRAGQNLSGVRTVDGERVIYEARSLQDGAGVLVYQEAQVAAAPQEAAGRRLLLGARAGLGGAGCCSRCWPAWPAPRWSGCCSPAGWPHRCGALRGLRTGCPPARATYGWNRRVRPRSPASPMR